jgi:hypothetical protein
MAIQQIQVNFLSLYCAFWEAMAVGAKAETDMSNRFQWNLFSSLPGRAVSPKGV